jgi:hypothetical protein
MADIKISALPVSGGLDGTEIVPIVDGGATQRTTTQAIANLADTGAISFALGAGVYIAQSDDTALGVALANDDLSSVLGVNGSATNGIVGQTTGNINFLANTDDQAVIVSANGVNGQMAFVANGTNGSILLESLDAGTISISASTVTLSGPSITAHANEDASLFVDGGAGVYATAVDNTLLLASPVANAVVDIQANGADGSVSVSATGLGGSVSIDAEDTINLNATNVLVNGSPIGGIPNELWIAGSSFAGNGDGFTSPGGSGNYVGYGFPSGQNRFGVATVAIPDGWNTFSVTYYVANAGDANLSSDYLFESTYQLASQDAVLSPTAVSHTTTFPNAGINALAIGVATPDITVGGEKVLNYLVRSNNATQGVVTQIILIGLLLTRLT